MADYSFGKEEKLKSKKKIEELFLTGNTLFVYPVKLIYLPNNNDPEKTNHQFAVSVPKKRFRKAVHRNRIKRLIREAYRLNKHHISLLPPVAMMAIYIADEELPFNKVESSIKKILKLLEKSISNP